MVQFLSSWAKGLGLAIVIVSILEMLLPNGKIKKYINVVMGIFILFNIISPLIENKDIFDFNTIETSRYLENTESKINEQVDQTSMNQRIAQLYKEEMEKDIATKLENQGYIINSCKVSVNLEDSEESRITKIKVNVKKNANATENRNEDNQTVENTLIKEVQKIRKVEIQSNEGQESENVSKADISNIKKFLIEEYEVNEQCLEIN